MVRTGTTILALVAMMMLGSSAANAGVLDGSAPSAFLASGDLAPQAQLVHNYGRSRGYGRSVNVYRGGGFGYGGFGNVYRGGFGYGNVGFGGFGYGPTIQRSFYNPGFGYGIPAYGRPGCRGGGRVGGGIYIGF